MYISILNFDKKPMSSNYSASTTESTSSTSSSYPAWEDNRYNLASYDVSTTSADYTQGG